MGESVKNDTPWDTRRPPRGNFSLTKHGVTVWWTIFPHYSWDHIGDSDKGSCTEAPQIGATVREPVEQEVDKTPLTGGGRPSPSKVSGENLECLAEKVGTLGLRTTSKNRCGAPKKQARKALMVCHDELTKDWLVNRVPTLLTGEGSRLKLVGLDALPTYRRDVAWFPGPAEDAERYLLRLRRLNQGLDTRQWRVYEHREEPKGVRLVLSIDAASVSALEKLRWRPYSGVGQATFSLLGTRPEGKK